LNVSEAAIRLWESQGRLHSLRFGKLRRIPSSEIERLLRYGLDGEEAK